MSPLTTQSGNTARVAHFRASLRTYMVLVAMLSLALAYVGSYYRLSRRGMSEAQVYGIPGFVYVPADEVIASVPNAAFSQAMLRHQRLYWFFVPLNWLDRSLFGGKHPACCLMRLSG